MDVSSGTCMENITNNFFSAAFKLLPGLIPFVSLWHAGRILDINVNMNTNFN